jgi:hypothetical protein
MSGVGPKAEVDEHPLLGFDPSHSRFSSAFSFVVGRHQSTATHPPQRRDGSPTSMPTLHRFASSLTRTRMLPRRQTRASHTRGTFAFAAPLPMTSMSVQPARRSTRTMTSSGTMAGMSTSTSPTSTFHGRSVTFLSFCLA